MSVGPGICYKSWLEVREFIYESDIGKPDIAHVGNYNDQERLEVIAEREREELAVWEAVSYAASSGSR
jgi:hypothetical protein